MQSWFSCYFLNHQCEVSNYICVHVHEDVLNKYSGISVYGHTRTTAMYLLYGDTYISWDSGIFLVDVIIHFQAVELNATLFQFQRS